jgi:hypothetical protein
MPRNDGNTPESVKKRIQKRIQMSKRNRAQREREQTALKILQKEISRSQ